MGILDRFKNKKEEVKAERIAKKVVEQQLTRFGMELSNWKTGIDNWEDTSHPTTEELIRVYNDIVLDPHLSAVMDVRKSKTLSKEYKIVDDKGEEIYEESAIFNSTWFRDFLKLALDSKFYGYSLIQFKDRINKTFEAVEIVPREYVYPQKKAVRTFPSSNEPLISLEQPKYKPWLFLIGNGKELGLLAKASPMMIYKKTAQGAWAEFAELFGSPLRVGKTNVRDKALRENMFYMLENMGRSAFAVLDHDDTIEMISDKKTDAYQVFDKLIERANSEVSKLVTGSTMTVDDGSSRSQSEVHERTAQAIDKDDSIFLEELVNNRLIPFLNEYHDFNIKGVFMWDSTERMTLADQFKRDIELIKSKAYKIPADYITETYGVPLEELEQKKVNDNNDPNNPGGPDNLDNSLKKKALSLDSQFFCEVCNNIDSSDLPPIDWNDLTVEDVINGVFSGKYTVENLPESVYFKIASELTKGVDSGLSAVGAFADTTDSDFLRSLKNNAFKFSGAKTFQQVREMSDFIYDNAGRRVNFSEYEAKAREIFDAYNRNWLKTEVAQASNSAQMASKWQDIEADQEDFPFLRYDTVGDQRVRDDHKELDGIIRPVNDPFWETHYPPNGWNCRCTVLQEDDSAEPTLLDINKLPDLPKGMDINVGQKKLLFSPEHPYFTVEDQFKELAENNFNLPIPRDFKRSESILVELEGWKGKHRYGTLTGKKLEQQKSFEKALGFKIPDSLVMNIDPDVYYGGAKTGYYLKNKKQVNFGVNGPKWGNEDYKTRIVAHELGHAIEKNLDPIKKVFINNKETTELRGGFKKLFEGAQKELKDLGPQNVINNARNEATRMIKTAKTQEEKQNIHNQYNYFLDTLGDLTTGKYGGGHSPKYYKENKGVEFFAHTSENYYVGNYFREKYLPKTYESGINYFKNLINE